MKDIQAIIDWIEIATQSIVVLQDKVNKLEKLVETLKQ